MASHAKGKDAAMQKEMLGDGGLRGVSVEFGRILCILGIL